SASLSPVGDLGYSAIDQIAQFGLSSLKVIYYSEQLFRRGGGGIVSEWREAVTLPAQTVQPKAIEAGQ
ncbi:hypothetical protein K3H84_25885, partial [Klebsiella pneumoniae]|uniref:hypothetical protein n=1 Tax=Klebsiella pneumoniae TaxID=573 RepID=UPI0021F36D7A